MLFHHLTAFYKQQCRDAAYAVAGCGFRAFIDVKFSDKDGMPDISFAISSMIGAIILHGPHHSAQKSTMTGS